MFDYGRDLEVVESQTVCRMVYLLPLQDLLAVLQGYLLDFLLDFLDSLGFLD